MQDSDVIFEWVVHPLRDEPKKLPVFVIAMIAVVAAVWFSFHDVTWTVLAAMFILGSLHRFWLPLKYRLGEREIELSRGILRNSRSLENYRRVVIGDRWVFLSPFSEPSRLDGHRGLLVQLGPNAAEVIRFIESKIEKVVKA